MGNRNYTCTGSFGEGVVEKALYTKEGFLHSNFAEVLKGMRIGAGWHEYGVDMFEKERNRGTEKDVNADAVQNAFRSCNEMGKSLYAENKMIRNDMKESNHSCYDSTIKFQTPEKATMFIRLKDGYGKVKIGPAKMNTMYEVLSGANIIQTAIMKVM